MAGFGSVLSGIKDVATNPNVLAGVQGAMQGSMKVREDNKKRDQAIAVGNYMKALQSGDDNEIKRAYDNAVATNVLTPEQVSKLGSLMDAHESRKLQRERDNKTYEHQDWQRENAKTQQAEQSKQARITDLSNQLSRAEQSGDFASAYRLHKALAEARGQEVNADLIQSRIDYQRNNQRQVQDLRNIQAQTAQLNLEKAQRESNQNSPEAKREREFLQEWKATRESAEKTVWATYYDKKNAEWRGISEDQVGAKINEIARDNFRVSPSAIQNPDLFKKYESSFGRRQAGGLNSDGAFSSNSGTGVNIFPQGQATDMGGYEGTNIPQQAGGGTLQGRTPPNGQGANPDPTQGMSDKDRTLAKNWNRNPDALVRDAQAKARQNGVTVEQYLNQTINSQNPMIQQIKMKMIEKANGQGQPQAPPQTPPPTQSGNPLEQQMQSSTPAQQGASTEIAGVTPQQASKPTNNEGYLPNDPRTGENIISPEAIVGAVGKFAGDVISSTGDQAKSNNASLVERQAQGNERARAQEMKIRSDRAKMAINGMLDQLSNAEIDETQKQEIVAKLEQLKKQFPDLYKELVAMRRPNQDIAMENPNQDAITPKQRTA